MRLVDKLEQVKAIAPTRAPGTKKITKLKAREERERVYAEKLAKERERLTEVDRVLAQNLRVPDDLKGRGKLAKELQTTSGGRTRTNREIGAIMGCSNGMVWYYLHPEQYEETKDAKRTGRPSAVDVRKAASAERDTGITAPDTTENFGSRLMRRRRAAGLSKSEFARRMGVEPEQVTEWESTRTRPSPGVYLKLMEVLD